MRSTKLVPDVISYSAAISALEKSQQWQQALSLLEGDAVLLAGTERDQLQRGD